MKRICSVNKCEFPSRRNGMCEKHSGLFRKYGTTDPHNLTPVVDRFLKHVNKTETCWLWTGGKDKDGYGLIRIKGKLIRAHRASWELFCGPIPDGLDALHKCDNPPCVNTDHLYLGTNMQNVQDRVDRKRGADGVKHPNAHFTKEQIQDIRRRYHPYRYPASKLAAQFGVSVASIIAIVKRRTYKDIHWEK